MSSEPQQTTESQARAHEVAEQAFRDHVAQVVMHHVGTEVDLAESRHRALVELAATTGRSLSTIKNWVNYRTGSPDLESMARIMARWKVAADDVFPPHLLRALSTGPDAPAAPAAEMPIAAKDAVVLRLSGRNDVAQVSEATQRYSDRATGLIFVRQEGHDAAGVVEAGELMLVDASVERIERSGLYILRIPGASGDNVTVLRTVHRLVSKSAARVHVAGQALSSFGEELDLTAEHTFVTGIAVLGRVVAVLRAV